ncbi:MAG: hypothetical protein M1326_00075, partial [Cyanobacteria bacterium]|nr:hypothetical protein [Cyanobacteriota bacterium]
FLLLFIWYLNNYSKNYIYIIILLLFFIVNIYSFVTYYPYAGLSSRKNLVEITMQKLGNNSYYLTCLDCNYGFLGGWRYLFKIYGKTPSKSKIDKLFHRYYPEEISQKDPKKSIILSNGDYNLIYQKIYTAAEVGPFTSYILDYKDFTN